MFARCLLAVATTAALVVAATAADPTLPDGKYALATAGGAVHTRIAVFELKTTDGKTDVKTISGGPSGYVLSGWQAKDGVITMEAKVQRTLTFEGKPDASGGRVLGTLADDTGRVIGRAVVAKTDLDEITAANANEPQKELDAYKQYNALRSAPGPFSAKAQQEKDPEKRKELIEQMRAAVAKFQADGPPLLRKAADE
jgi:hypothetical protein